MIWDLWLRDLMNLSVDAPEWANVDEFLEAIKELAEQKSRERKAMGQQRLAQALHRLATESRDMLQKFEFEDSTGWSAESCATELAANLAQESEDFCGKLEERRRLAKEDLPAGATIRQEEEHWDRLRALDAEIRAAYEGLAKALGGLGKLPPQPPAPGIGPPTNPPAVSETAPPLPSPPERYIGSDNSGTEEAGMAAILQPEQPQVQPEVPSVVQLQSPPPTLKKREQTPVNVRPPVRLEPKQRQGEAEQEQQHGKIMPIAVLPPKLVAPQPPGIRYPTARRTGLPELWQVARELQEGDRVETWVKFFWALVAANDLPGAYWLSRAIETKGALPPAPSWLIAAVQGGFWLSGTDDLLAYDLVEFAGREDAVKADSLLKLAAGLHTSLIVPESGMASLLEIGGSLPGFRTLVAAITHFAEQGVPLRTEHVSQLLAEGPIDAKNFRGLAERAAKWITDAAKLGGKYVPAVRVWRLLVNPEEPGPLLRMVGPVAKNDRNALESVRQELRTFGSHSRAQAAIQRIFRKEFDSDRSIEGKALQRLMQECDDASELARQWCELVERDRRGAQRPRESDPRVLDLVRAVTEALPEAEQALAQLRAPEKPLSVAAAAHSLEYTLARMCELLQVEHSFETKLSAEPECHYWRDRDDPSLQTSLTRRLWWFPEVSRDIDGRLAEDSSSGVILANALRDAAAEGRTLETAFHAWLEKRDFRYARLILAEQEGSPQYSELVYRYDDLLEDARNRLSAQVDLAKDGVETGVLDGYVYEERSEFLTLLESIDAGAVQHFSPAFDRVQAIRNRLQELRDQRIEHVWERWHKLETSLADRKDLDQASKSAVCDFIRSAHNQRDTRVLDECVSRVAEMLAAEGADIQNAFQGWFAPPPDRDPLTEYVAVSDYLSGFLEDRSFSWLLDEVARGHHPLEQFKIRIPDGERCEQVKKALKSWAKLKQARATPDPNDVAPIMAFLGFNYKPVSGVGIKKEGDGPAWMFVRAYFSSADAAPIPQFGSDAHGEHRVLCVWGRPGAGRIGEILKELNIERQPVIIFYLGHRPDAERHSLARLARERGHAVAALDENLLLFLAGERDTRLKAFLRCSLPYSALVPYTPNRRGKVAEEMFVGREEMVRDIWDQNGSCIMYGGRQLGKTTIQRRVIDLYNRPEQEQYVWFEHTDNVFDPGANKPAENLWLFFAEKLKDTGLIVKTSKPEGIAEAIAKHVAARPSLRVLIMLDEADKFLDADSTEDFREVKRIRNLMDQTGRRFKIVFAGNRKVQRFQAIADNPLVHFGAPLLVGPLEPDAARKLIRRPLEALGYRFDSDSTVLHVLSYTNYHAVCIHQFGEALLRRLRSRPDLVMPQKITREDVDLGYADKSMREIIRETFINTLALEDDYLVTTLAMIRDQMAVRDSFSKAYSAAELYDLAWETWPQGFEDVPLDIFRLRLDEMCGLGVLVKASTGYFLRSPNLVRLVTSDDTVDSLLAQVQIKVRQPKDDIEAYHAPLDVCPVRYSPLTYAQEKALNQRQTGVALVFASEALGLGEFPAVFARLIPANLPEDVGRDFSEIPPGIQTSDPLKDWLKRYVEEHPKHERLVLWHRLDASGDIEGCVRSVLDFCKAHPSERRWLRVHMVLDPASTWKWLSLRGTAREDLESRADAVVTPRKWGLAGIRKRLEQQDRPASDDVCRQVLAATGGWPGLLEALVSDAAHENPAAAATNLTVVLGPHDGDMAARFRQSLGLDCSDAASRLFSFVRSSPDLPVEYISPVLLGEYGIHSEGESEAALKFLETIGCIDVVKDLVVADSVVDRVLPRSVSASAGA
jgi:hypothetical protein